MFPISKKCSWVIKSVHGYKKMFMILGNVHELVQIKPQFWKNVHHSKKNINDLKNKSQKKIK